MLYLIDLEAVDTRYTKQWRHYLPMQLREAGIETTVIPGGHVPQVTTPGAFLNFAGTNHYKSQQMIRITQLFTNGTIKDGDYFLYTDAWNPTVIQLKYMASLLGIKIRIGGMWHAGSYDPQDFLGRLIGDVPWVRNAESSMFYCYDDNFFATDFHIKMFINRLFGCDDVEDFMKHHPSVKRVGWPMEYMYELLASYMTTPKENKIIFPHRLAPEKQPEIARDLANSTPEYEWVFAQETTLTKAEYYRLLGESKIVFSANLQETLGISVYEGAMMGSFPLMPDRLSYSEMWPGNRLYPSEWTESWESYLKHKDELIAIIHKIMNEYEVPMLVESRSIAEDVGVKYFDGHKLYQTIIDSTT